MDLTFGSSALAGLCNSERRLVERWGADLGRLVARRLLDLSAVDAAAILRLPGARMVSANGQTVITFHGIILVRGVINSINGSGAAIPGADSMVITDLDVLGSDQR